MLHTDIKVMFRKCSKTSKQKPANPWASGRIILKCIIEKKVVNMWPRVRGLASFKLQVPLNARTLIKPLPPKDPYSGRTAPLTSKRCILYIYSTNTGTEYFKHGIYCPFFSLQNAVRFILLTYLVPVLFTFYIQSVLKLKKIIPAPKG